MREDGIGSDGACAKNTTDLLDQGGLEGVRDIGAKLICLTALTIAAEGGKADIAKPMHGLGSGVFELALPHRGDAFRVVYAVQIANDIWAVHAFQKKSTQGIKTPKREIELIRERLKTLKELLR